MPSPNDISPAISLAERPIPQAALALLRDLISSLLASQQALLALDLAGIEKGASEQTALSRALDALLRGDAPLGIDSRAAEECERVLHLVRVQAALLMRAQRALRIQGMLLSGPAGTYLPCSAGNGVRVLLPGWE